MSKYQCKTILEFNYNQQLNLIKQERLNKINERIQKILLVQKTHKVINPEFEKVNKEEIQKEIQKEIKSIIEVGKANESSKFEEKNTLESSDLKYHKATTNLSNTFFEDIKEDNMKPANNIILSQINLDSDLNLNQTSQNINNPQQSIQNIIISKNNEFNINLSQPNILSGNVKLEERDLLENKLVVNDIKIQIKKEIVEPKQINDEKIYENQASIINNKEEDKNQKPNELNLISDKLINVKQETSSTMKETEITLNSPLNVSKIKINNLVSMSIKSPVEENKFIEKANVILSSDKKGGVSNYLKNELEILRNSPNMNGIRYEINENNCNSWKLFIDIHKQEILTPLYNQFIEFSKAANNNKNELILEIKFKDNYPLSPPLIRIFWPKLLNSNHIFDKNGSISLDILSEEEWNNDTMIHSLEMIIISILNELIESNISFDFTKIEGEFNLKEAGELNNPKSHQN